MNLRIVKSSRHQGSSRTGTVSALTKAQISSKLGFKADDPSKHPDSDGKVTAEWSFTVQGIPCAIWSFKRGGEEVQQWSAFGPELALKAIFGDHYSAGN